jgi:hypothetical protein
VIAQEPPDPENESLEVKQKVKSSTRESRGLARGTTCKALAYNDDDEDEDEGTPPSSDKIQRSNRLQHRLHTSKMMNESYKCKKNRIYEV